jgi:hypothetical protein
MTEQIEKWVRRGGMLAALSVLVSSGCQSAGTQSNSAEPRSVSKSTGWTQKSVMPSEPSFPEGFICCNLHYEDDWISDSNYADLPMIPAGTTAKVTRYGRHRAHADIAGKPMRLGHDYGRGRETLQQWTAKMIVAEDPKLKIETYPQAIQEAIKQGRLSVGMTKEQVIISVGYPMTSENYSLDATVWRMWMSSFRKYQVMWGPDGRVKEIVPDPGTGDIMIYKP